MRKLVFKNKALIHYFFGNALLFCIMKEEVAVPVFIQDSCKYLSFVLHQTMRYFEKLTKFSLYYFICNTYTGCNVIY